MATQTEVRRAIYWAELFLNKLYQEFTWNGKTYGVIKACPSTPFSVTLRTKPPLPSIGYVDLRNRNWLTAGDGIQLSWIPCVHDADFLPDAIIETTSNTGEAWEGKIKFQYWLGMTTGEYVAVDVCTLKVRYAPSPADPKRMRIEITIEDAQVDLGLSLYLSMTCILPNMTAADIGRTLTYETGQFGAFPSNEVALRADCEFYATYGWFDSPRLRDRATKVKAFLDYLGFDPAYYQLAAQYRLTDKLATDYPVSEYPEAFPECPIWNNLPRSVGLTYYWSKKCFCETITELDQKYHCPFWHPLHWMNKYKDPYKKVLYCSKTYGVVTPVTVDYYNTAYDTLVGKAYLASVDNTLLLCNPPEYPYNLTQDFVPGKGFGTGDFYATRWSVLESLSVLGYGFGVEEAKVLADQIADVYIKAQWGYPFTPGQEGYGYSYEYNRINRPDLTGAFMPGWQVAEGSTIFKATAVAVPGSSSMQLLNIHAFDGDWGIYMPFSHETTMGVLTGLRIYEFYKWRLPR